MLRDCKPGPGLPKSGWWEGNLQLTWAVSDMKSWVTGVSCVVRDMLVTQAQDGNHSNRPLRLTESCYSTFSCIYTVNIYTHLVLGRKVCPCSVHTSWSKMVQVGLLMSHYVVCTDSHVVRYPGGIQNLVALVCFFFLICLFLNCLLSWIRCIY